MRKKIQKILAWILQILLGIEFVIAGQAKFTMANDWSIKFSDWGLPDHFYLGIGALELIGGIMLFFPKLAAGAAVGLIAIMLGATFTHLIHAESNQIIITLILISLLFIVFLFRRKDLYKRE